LEAGLEAPRQVASGGTFALIGVVIYVVLLVVTGKLLHRRVTTELVLIVGWCVLEAVVLNAVYGSGALSASRAVAYLVLMIAALVIGLVCYLLYYKLPDMTAFRVAAVPLVVDGLCMVVFVGMLLAGGAG